MGRYKPRRLATVKNGLSDVRGVDMPLLAEHFHENLSGGMKEMFMNKDQRKIQRKLRVLQ
jgi:hypothetical protein